MAHLQQMWYRVQDDAAASGAHGLWKVAVVLTNLEEMRDWKITVMIWMCSVCLHDPDPDGTYAEWRDEADESDARYIRWADSAWEEIRTKPSFQLLEAIRDLRAL